MILLSGISEITDSPLINVLHLVYLEGSKKEKIDLIIGNCSAAKARKGGSEKK
jgi:hypothetical protein